jgi:hypothetical protein
MDGRHSFDNIIGGTPEDKESIDQYYNKVSTENPDDISGHEIEKTSEMTEVSNRTMSYVDKVASAYSSKIKGVPIDKVYFLKEGSTGKLTNITGNKGFYNIKRGYIVIDRLNSKIGTASVLAHELFHAKAYKSIKYFSDTKDDFLYRSGVEMVDISNPTSEYESKKKYFAEMDEAIVQKLASKTAKLMEKDPLFSSEYQASQELLSYYISYCVHHNVDSKILEEITEELRYIPQAEERLEKMNAAYKSQKEREDYIVGLIKGLLDSNNLLATTRYSERKKFDKLLDEIVEKSSGRFANREEVFTEFAKAHFSGDYMNIARIVEGALGKGSFRRIANEFSGQIEEDAPATDVES